MFSTFSGCPRKERGAEGCHEVVCIDVVKCNGEIVLEYLYVYYNIYSELEVLLGAYCGCTTRSTVVLLVQHREP